MSSDPDPLDQVWNEHCYDSAVALNWTHRFCYYNHQERP